MPRLHHWKVVQTVCVSWPTDLRSVPADMKNTANIYTTNSFSCALAYARVSRLEHRNCTDYRKGADVTTDKMPGKKTNDDVIHNDSYGPAYDVTMSPEPRNSSRSFSALFWSPVSFLLRCFVRSLSLLPGVRDRSEFRSLCLRCFRSDFSASCKYRKKW